MKRALVLGWLAAVGALSLFGLTLGGLAHAQATGRMVGQVTNGTRTAAPASVAKLGVSLFQMTARGPVSQTTRTDEKGQFAFEGLPAGPGTAYFARVDYAGVKYFSDIVSLDGAAQASLPISVTVYETMPAPPGLHIDQAHLIFDVSPQGLQGIQLVRVSNSTDRAFWMPLPIPEGALQFGFEDPRDQARSQTLAGGQLAMPVLPPGSQFVYGYILPVRPPEYTLRLALPFPVDLLSLLVADVNHVQLSSPQLAAAEPFATQQGARYVQLAGQRLAGGMTVVANITNLSGADTSSTTRNLVLVAGGLGTVGLIAWPLARGGRGGTPSRREPARQARRVELVQALAALDEAHGLDEAHARDGASKDDEVYLAARAELKAELIELLQEEK